MGFLLLLERLTPLERAVFVLHDVLDHPYREIADAVGRAEAACRQALHRARRHVTVPARRTPADRAHAARVAERFLAAGLGGDVDAFVAALAPDIVLTSDGGGLVHAAMRPVVGVERVTRFLGNLAGRFTDDAFVVAHELNGTPGFVVHAGGAWVALVLEVRGEQVAAIRAVVSPPKLERLLATLPGTAERAGAWETPGRFRHRRGRPSSRTDRRSAIRPGSRHDSRRVPSSAALSRRRWRAVRRGRVRAAARRDRDRGRRILSTMPGRASTSTPRSRSEAMETHGPQQLGIADRGPPERLAEQPAGIVGDVRDAGDLGVDLGQPVAVEGERVAVQRLDDLRPSPRPTAGRTPGRPAPAPAGRRAGTRRGAWRSTRRGRRTGSCRPTSRRAPRRR